ncbi:MAG: radical SAM protein [Planctomycetota bacterium]
MERLVQRFSMEESVHEPILSREQNIAAYARHRQDPSAPFSNLPLTLQVELTRDCNLRCRKCNRTYWPQDDTCMSEELLEATLDLARTTRNIFPFGFGESLLFPGVAEAVGRFKALGNQVALLSNGMMLDQKMIEAFIVNGLDGVGVSLDAATPERLAQIRKGADFNRITNNIMTLNQIKKSLNVTHPLLGLNVVVENCNFLDLPSIFDMAERWSVHFINLTPMAAPDHLDEREIEKPGPLEEVREVLDICHQKAGKSGIHMNMEELRLMLEKTPPSSVYQSAVSCPEPIHIMCIGAGGDLYPCCRWDQKKPFGRFPNMDLKKAWMSEAWVRLRKDIQQGSYPSACIRCMDHFSRPRGDSNLIG